MSTCFSLQPAFICSAFAAIVEDPSGSFAQRRISKHRNGQTIDRRALSPLWYSNQLQWLGFGVSAGRRLIPKIKRLDCAPSSLTYNSLLPRAPGAKLSYCSFRVTCFSFSCKPILPLVTHLKSLNSLRLPESISRLRSPQPRSCE